MEEERKLACSIFFGNIFLFDPESLFSRVVCDYSESSGLFLTRGNHFMRRKPSQKKRRFCFSQSGGGSGGPGGRGGAQLCPSPAQTPPPGLGAGPARWWGWRGSVGPAVLAALAAPSGHHGPCCPGHSLAPLRLDPKRAVSCAHPPSPQGPCRVGPFLTQPRPITPGTRELQELTTEMRTNVGEFAICSLGSALRWSLSYRLQTRRTPQRRHSLVTPPAPLPSPMWLQRLLPSPPGFGGQLDGPGQ